VDPHDVANLNQEQLYKRLREFGYPVTRYLIKQAVLRRELKPVRLGVGNYFSVNDGLRWIESRRQPGIYRAPESIAN
jgi:hypothetical protein